MSSAQVLESLISDGARFRDDQYAIREWFTKEHDIIFARHPYGQGWTAKYRSTGANIDKYPSFSAMLIDLIGRITSARASS